MVDNGFMAFIVDLETWFKVRFESNSKNIECFLCDKLSQYSLWQKITDHNIDRFSLSLSLSLSVISIVATALRSECAMKIALQLCVRASA